MRNHFSFEERLHYIKEYGNHCMSSSILQPDMQYYDVPGRGFIAYLEKWGKRIALANPVCDVRDREALVGGMLNEWPETSFLQASESMARLMHEDFRFYSTQLGVETLLEPNQWTLKGRKKQVLRTSLNQASKRRVRVGEACDDASCKSLSRKWLETRRVRNKEIAFLVRPMDMNLGPVTRKFCAYENDALVGFTYFDPIYEKSEVIGYVPNISRASASFKQGIYYTILVKAMEVFRREGIRLVNLGLSPLVLDKTDLACESRPFKECLRKIYRYGNRFYNFPGIHFTKSRFGGQEQKVYFCHRRKLPLMEALAIFRLSEVL